MSKQGNSRVIDFRKGKSTWGHALHGSTMSLVKSKNLFRRFLDWREGALRYSMMCHCSQSPRIGDNVLWTSNNGEISATIYAVECCRDPRDMFKICVKLLPSGRIAHPSGGDRHGE